MARQEVGDFLKTAREGTASRSLSGEGLLRFRFLDKLFNGFWLIPSRLKLSMELK